MTDTVSFACAAAAVVTVVVAAVSIALLFGVAALVVHSIVQARGTSKDKVGLHHVGEIATTSGLEVRVVGYRNPVPP